MFYILTCNSPPAYRENIFFSGASLEGEIIRDVSSCCIIFRFISKKTITTWERLFSVMMIAKRKKYRGDVRFASLWATTKGDDEMKVYPI